MQAVGIRDTRFVAPRFCGSLVEFIWYSYRSCDFTLTLILQINRRMEFVFASHSFDVWESWTFEGTMEECRLVNCRNPLVSFSSASNIQNSSSPAPSW